MKPFTGIGRSPDDEGVLRAAQIMDWSRAAFGLDDATTVLVAEIACTDPGCPPIETVIALLRDDDRSEHRIHLSPIRERHPGGEGARRPGLERPSEGRRTG